MKLEEIKKIATKANFIFGLIILLSFLIRIYSWSHLQSLTWDEGGHSNPGIMLARIILNGFSISYAAQFISNYTPAAASFVFYPYGYSIMSMFSFLFFGFSELAARIPSMFFSLLIIHGVYILAKKMFGTKIGLISAFIAALNPWFIIWGGRALADLPMVCLMLYSIYFCFKAIENIGIKYWLLSGLFCGLAVLMKPPGLIVFPFLILIVAYYKGLKELFKKHFFVLTTTIFLISFSYFGFALLARYILPVLGLISYEYGLNIFKGVFHWFGSALEYAEMGDPTWKTLAGWRYYLGLLPVQLGGYLTLFLGFIGGLRLIKNRNSRSKFYLIFSYILFVYLLFTFLDNKDTRYTIPYLPFFCILASIGIKTLISAVSVFNRKIALITFLLILVFIGITSFNTLPIWNIWSTPSSGLAEAAKVIIQLEPGLIVSLAGSDNMVNVPTITFYVAVNDSKANYSVYWNERFKQAKYIISVEEINIPETKQIFKKADEPKLYMFRRKLDKTP